MVSALGNVGSCTKRESKEGGSRLTAILLVASLLQAVPAQVFDLERGLSVSGC